MTNKRQCYLRKLKDVNCQNIKRLPHSFNILKVIYTFSLGFIYVFKLQFRWNNIWYHFIHTCYKIYGYFEFHFFTNPLFSVVHNATLNFFYNCIFLKHVFISLFFLLYKTKCIIIDYISIHLYAMSVRYTCGCP